MVTAGRTVCSADIIDLSQAHQAEEQVWKLLEKVTDPEVPVLTVLDLGVVREVKMHGLHKVEITITPTYSGCPAMDTIEADIRSTLAEAGFEEVVIETVLSPAWTTDWLSEDGRRKLKEYGIAPPGKVSASKRALFGEEPAIECPRCGSANTEMTSQFGSTACKALHRCLDCLEPFDYFKCL